MCLRRDVQDACHRLFGGGLARSGGRRAIRNTVRWVSGCRDLQDSCLRQFGRKDGRLCGRRAHRGPARGMFGFWLRLVIKSKIEASVQNGLIAVIQSVLMTSPPAHSIPLWSQGPHYERRAEVLATHPPTTTPNVGWPFYKPTDDLIHHFVPDPCDKQAPCGYSGGAQILTITPPSSMTPTHQGGVRFAGCAQLSATSTRGFRRAASEMEPHTHSSV